MTSPYSLIINEDAQTKISNYEENSHVYHQFLRLPTKPIAGAYTLADVHNQKQRIDGKILFLNLFLSHLTGRG